MINGSVWGLCRVCDKPIEDGDQWLALNRYLVGTGHAHEMAEAQEDDGEYVWEHHVDGDPDDRQCSAVALHWPVCASMWIEGKIADVNVSIPPEEEPF